jgi:hypothetical protein
MVDYLVWGKNKENDLLGGKVAKGKRNALKLKSQYEKNRKFKNYVFHIRKYE